MPPKKSTPKPAAPKRRSVESTPASASGPGGNPPATAGGPTITDVPKDQVGRVVQSFVDDGAKTVEVESTGGGFYSVSPS